ncbi:acyltransferase [Hymenobacter psoromatis]|uniref:acyltransferase n=1 Tax=Hymenobacter psoromatis TaxID=1484116 RepID=UPI001CBB6D08|nr:acyltransferase [Hymenobacter psoromatis]
MQIHRFENGSYIIAEHLQLGHNVQIGPHTAIRATECIIGDDVTIGSHNAFLVGQRLEIGMLTTIGSHNTLTARTIKLGEYIFWDSHVTVGHGGKFSPDAHLTVGSYSMICARITLNTNHRIDIGEHVGIGEDVAVWTHGSFLPILDGFPADFGPVSIGHHVWLPARSTVLPNRRIGNNVVIGTNTLINKDLPDGCLAGGIPVRVLKENVYPSHNPARNANLMRQVLHDYIELAAYKDLQAELHYDEDKHLIRCNEVIFNLSTLKTQGTFTRIEEDFRDYLRRRGIKFFTGKPFSSVLPEEYRRLLYSPNDLP